MRAIPVRLPFRYEVWPVLESMVCYYSRGHQGQISSLPGDELSSTGLSHMPFRISWDDKDILDTRRPALSSSEKDNAASA